jgi:hypothetical protein
MPAIDDQLVLGATNNALAALDPAGRALASLNDPETSNVNWSCNNFSPIMLENVLDMSGYQGQPLSTEYGTNVAEWPNNFPPASVVNFSISSIGGGLSNHNFNVYFKSNNSSYIIQVYLEHEVRISTLQNSTEFIERWKQLVTPQWATAYQQLFYVQPSQKNVYVSQHVTVVTTS